MTNVRKASRLSLARTGVMAVVAAAAWLITTGAVRVSPHDLPLRRERVAAVHAEAASLEAAAERATRMRAAVSGLRSRAAALENAVILRSSPAETLGRIGALAAESRLRISRLTPAPVRPRPPLSEWSCSLTATGTFRDVETFFMLVGALAPRLTIDAFTVRRAAAADNSPLMVEVVVKALTSGESVSAPARSAIVVQRPRPAARTNLDPFQDDNVELADEAPGPTGLRGVRISDVTLHGVLVGPGSAVALLGAPDRRTYVASPGMELLDGRVTAVAKGSVTFAARDEAGAEKHVVIGLSRGRR